MFPVSFEHFRSPGRKDRKYKVQESMMAKHSPEVCHPATRILNLSVKKTIFGLVVTVGYEEGGGRGGEG